MRVELLYINRRGTSSSIPVELKSSMYSAHHHKMYSLSCYSHVSIGSEGRSEEKDDYLSGCESSEGHGSLNQ
jgi:hypothetical protein